jgi:hypothetical protein
MQDLYYFMWILGEPHEFARNYNALSGKKLISHPLAANPEGVRPSAFQGKRLWTAGFAFRRWLGPLIARGEGERTPRLNLKFDPSNLMELNKKER